MKVLSLIDFFNPECVGGAARVFYEVNIELINRGHSVQAICRGWEENEHRTFNIDHSTSNEENTDNPFSPSDLGLRATDHGEQVIFHTYPDIEGSQLKKIRYYGRSINRLFNESLSRNSPDLIIVHSSSAVFGLHEELKKINIPIIYYSHSPWNMEYEILASKKCCGIQSPLVSILSYIRKLHEKKYIKLASGIVTLSKAMQDILLEVHPSVKTKKLLIDPGAADGKRFFSVRDKEEMKSIRQELGLNSDDFLIITSRRLVPRTGVDVLIKSFAEVLNRCYLSVADSQKKQEIKENVEQVLPMLILTGGGGEENKLKQLTTDLGISKNVIFTGHVSEEDLAKYYRCSDLFVMPTKYLEGFGLSTVEAMASGLAVIGTSVGGTPEILRKISDDLIIPECSIGAIADKIFEFMNKKDFDEFRKKSIECFRDNFTWKKHVDKLLEFVANLK